MRDHEWSGDNPVMGHILLVEDNPNDRILTQRAFKKSNLGNDLVTVNDGEEALHYLLGTDDVEPQPLPILVLLDLKLPKVDGLEVLKKFVCTNGPDCYQSLS